MAEEWQGIRSAPPSSSSDVEGSVMDIQKEKEAFENWWESFHNGRQISCDYVEKDNSYSVGYANAQWVAWQAKTPAVPEGFVLVSIDRLAKAVDEIEALFEEDCTLALGQLLPIQQDLNAMIEAREPVKQIIIHWGMECPKCNHNEATCYSTATQESGYEFMDGDAVVCLKCGNKGEMDANGEDSDIAWNEDEEQGHD